MADKTKSSLIAVILIAIIGFAIYANSLHNEFVYDDELVIKNNAFITKLSNIKYLFTKEYYAASGEFTYRPIPTLTYLLDYHFWKFNPVGYHLTNIFFHISTAVFIYFFILLLLPMLGSKLPAHPVALLSSLLFLMHPVQTEVVNSPAFRKDAVFSFFFFPALIFYLKTKSASGTKKALFYTFSLLCYFLALFSKELALGTVVILVLIDLCTWNPVTDKANVKKPNINKVSADKTLTQKISPYILYVILAIWFLYIELVKLASPAKVFKPHAILNLKYLIIMGSQHLIYYLKLLLFPFKLSVEYTFPKTTSILEPRVLFSLTGLVMLAIFVIRKFKTNRIFSFSVLWIFIFIGPTIVHPYVALAERFLYLSSVGFCFLLAAAIVKVARQKTYREIAVFLTTILLCAYAARTVTRNTVWKDALTFWEERVKNLPATPRAYTSLGNVYLDARLYDKAEEQFKASIETDPNYADAHVGLGNIYYEKGLYDKAIKEFQAALKLNPDINTTLFNLGNTYFKAGRYNEAIQEYKIFLNKQPFNLEANNNLGNIYYSMKNYDEAIKYFKKALEIKSDFTESWYNLANTYMAKGDYQEAVNTYKSLLEKYPSNYEARNNLATLYLSKEHYDDAITQLKKVIETKPDFVGAYYNLGNAYYKKGLNGEAIKEYENAININPSFTASYDNLGFVYFQMGMKEKAIELWRKALSIDANDTKAKSNLEGAGIKIQ